MIVDEANRRAGSKERNGVIENFRYHKWTLLVRFEVAERVLPYEKFILALINF